MTTYRTKQGDVLDAVCYAYYGRQAGTVEAVLEANPSLAGVGPILPSNLIVVMPEIDAAETETIVRLWE